MIFNVVMSYDCMPYMCLAVLYVLSCMFSVTILYYMIDDSKAQAGVICIAKYRL